MVPRMGNSSWDPDARDWRLRVDLAQSAPAGLLARTIGHLRDPAAIDEITHAVARDVVITHDGSSLFAYASGREAIERARSAIEAVLQRDGTAAQLKLTHWDEELDAWVDPDDVSPEMARERRAASETSSRTLVAHAGNWVREELEQSMKIWAEELGITCETMEEHPHLLDEQLAFTITGPARKLDEFEAGLKAEEAATIRTERQVMISPL